MGKKPRSKDEKKSKKHDDKEELADYTDEEIENARANGVIEICRATYNFNARSDAEISFKKGDYIEVMKKTESETGWWKGQLKGTTNAALFPSNYCTLVMKLSDGGSERRHHKRKDDDSASSEARRKKDRRSDRDRGGRDRGTRDRDNGSRVGRGSSGKDDTVIVATVLFDFAARKPEEISINRGEELIIVEKGAPGGWWRAETPDGKVGLMPSNYCKIKEKKADNDSRKMRKVSNLKSQLKDAERNAKHDDDDESADDDQSLTNMDESALRRALKKTRSQLKSSKKQVRVLQEKLRIAEEIIDNMDAMMKSSRPKKNDKYRKRQSARV